MKADKIQPRVRGSRIAILGSRGIPARYGGFETFAEQLSIRLVQAGFDVTVFCERGAEAGPSESRGVALEYVRSPSLGPLTAPVYDILSLFRARRSFDVVYMLGYGAGLFCWLPRLWGSEVWINMDGLEWKRAKWGVIGRAWLWLMSWAGTLAASRLIFDNAAVRKIVLGKRMDRVASSVIEYGAPIVDDGPGPEALAPYDLPAGSYFLVVCRVEPENHVLEIVRGASASKSDKILAIVGDVSRQTPYVRRVREAAGANVRFLGPIYDAEALLALRKHCAAYIHGHSVGGTNPSLLEAMACGNIPIVHDNPFNREVLLEDGLYFRTEDDLVRRIADCDRMAPAERRALEQRGRERVGSYYNWERIAACYGDLLARQGDGVAASASAVSGTAAGASLSTARGPQGDGIIVPARSASLARPVTGGRGVARK